MIIWLASYPKSGNTWVRIFINYLLYFDKKELSINSIKIGQFPNKKHFTSIIDDFSDIKKILENSIHAQDLLYLDENLKFFFLGPKNNWKDLINKKIPKKLKIISKRKWKN